MGSSYPGRNMWIGLGIQNGLAAGTASGATVFTYFEPTEVGGFLEEFAMQESQRRLGTRFKGKSYLGTKQVPASFSVELNADNCGRIFAAGMGAESVTVGVTSEAATHDFTFAETLPYLTVYCYAAGVADSSGNDKTIRALNCKVKTMALTGGLEGPMTLAVELVGTARSIVTSPTTTFTTVDPLFLSSEEGTGTLSLGATIGAAAAFDESREFELNIDNGVDADHRIDGSATPAAIREGASSITGRLGCVYNDTTWTEIDIFSACTDRAIKLVAVAPEAFITGYSYTVTIESHINRYTGSPPSWDPDVISVDLPFTAEAGTSSEVFTISVINDDVVAYTHTA